MKIGKRVNWLFSLLLIFIGNHFECSKNIKGKKKKDYMLPEKTNFVHRRAVKKVASSSFFLFRRPSLKFRGHFLGKKVWAEQVWKRRTEEWVSDWVFLSPKALKKKKNPTHHSNFPPRTEKPQYNFMYIWTLINEARNTNIWNPKTTNLMLTVCEH